MRNLCITGATRYGSICPPCRFSVHGDEDKMRHFVFILTLILSEAFSNLSFLLAVWKFCD